MKNSSTSLFSTVTKTKLRLSARLGLTALAALAAAISASSAARPTVSAKSTSNAITAEDVAKSALVRKSLVSESYGTTTNAQPQQGRSANVPELVGAWSVVAFYPFASESVSVASDGTFAYGAGGFNSNFPTNSFNRYDPVANTWTPLPNVPTAFADAPSVYDPNTNSIYVFGGVTVGGGLLATTQIYNIGTGTWTTGAPMPDPNGRFFASAAYYNGKIYVIGGFGSTFTEQSQTWEYDPVANTWDTSRAPIPVPMGGAGYSIVGQNVYLAGRYGAGGGSTDHYRYDIVANTWSAMAPVPVAIYRPDAAAIGTNIYLVGGGNPSLGAGSKGRNKSELAPHSSMRAPAVSYNSTYIYDTISNSWSSGPNTNVAHSFTGGTAIGYSLLVVTGGNGALGDTNIVEKATVGGIVCGPCPDSGLIANGGFETGSFPPWIIDGNNNTPVVNTAQPHSGTHAALMGTLSGTEPNGDSSFYQQFTVPAGGGTLSFWHWDHTADIITFDWQDAYITDSSGTILQTIFHVCDTTASYVNTTVDMAPYAGQTVRIKFLVHEDGFGDLTSMYVDDVALYDLCAPVPTSAVSRKVHGAAGPFDINLPLVPIDGAVGIEDRQQGTPSGVTLWYNGDFNAVNSLANEMDPMVAQSSIYDNFVVTTATGWDISAVFSDNLMSLTTITGANWEIRSGVSAGNGGTLVASGSTLTPTVTPTGRGGFNFTEYQVKVTGLSVHLPQLAAGLSYWLNVTPIGTDPAGRSFDSDTSGANAVGIPPGNDGNAFINSTTFAANFAPTGNPPFNQPADFSMGVIGVGAAGPGFSHQMVVTFANPVTVQSMSVTSGIVANFSVSGNVVTVNLTGVANAQRLGVTLHGVCDGTVMGDVLIPMGVLAGDTNASGTVSAADVSQTKAQSGNTTTAGNFREDVNASGSINAGDVALVKSKSGTVLPP